MQTAQQPGRAAQGEIGPRVGRQPAAVSGFPAGIYRHVTVEIAEHLITILDAEHPGRAFEADRFQLAQVLVHRG